jgi:hypothetical protein
MGDSGVTIPIGDCLPYLELKFKEMIGKDPESRDVAEQSSQSGHDPGEARVLRPDGFVNPNQPKRPVLKF